MAATVTILNDWENWIAKNLNFRYIEDEQWVVKLRISGHEESFYCQGSIFLGCLTNEGKLELILDQRGAKVVEMRAPDLEDSKFGEIEIPEEDESESDDSIEIIPEIIEPVVAVKKISTSKSKPAKKQKSAPVKKPSPNKKNKTCTKCYIF